MFTIIEDDRSVDFQIVNSVLFRYSSKVIEKRNERTH